MGFRELLFKVLHIILELWVIFAPSIKEFPLLFFKVQRDEISQRSVPFLFLWSLLLVLLGLLLLILVQNAVIHPVKRGYSSTSFGSFSLYCKLIGFILLEIGLIVLSDVNRFLLFVIFVRILVHVHALHGADPRAYLIQFQGCKLLVAAPVAEGIYALCGMRRFVRAQPAPLLGTAMVTRAK